MMSNCTQFLASRSVRGLLSIALAAATALLTYAPPARAVTITQDPTRSDESRTEQPFRISHSDCDGGNSFEFPIGDLLSGDDLTVWATGTGDDCSTNQARNVDLTCVQVTASGAGVVSNTSTTVTLAHSDIAAVMSGVSGCADSSSSDSPRSVKVYFIVDETQGDVTGSDVAVYDGIELDLIGPPAPTGVSADVNDDTSLKVSFTQPTGTSDIDSYKVYCATSTASAADYTGAAAGAGGAGGGGGAAPGGAGGAAVGGAGGAAVGGAGGTSASSASSGSGGAGGGSSGAGGGSCSSSELTPGEVPSVVECGSAKHPTSEIVVSGLQQDVEKAIGVASVDIVGNIGPLSKLACGSPMAVTDFFDRYREAGGQAGGGFCQCRAAGAPAMSLAALALGFAAAVGLGWRRERRGRGGR